MRCIVNIKFCVSAGGFKIDDFRYPAQVYNGGRYGNEILDLIAKIAQIRP